jgi:hypothetical protein
MLKGSGRVLHDITGHALDGRRELWVGLAPLSNLGKGAVSLFHKT